MSTNREPLARERRRATSMSGTKTLVPDAVPADLHARGISSLLALADRRLDRLAQHLATNLEQPLSLAKAAELCALETTYFSRYFRSRTGVNFIDWYRQLRIERAKTLLTNRWTKVESVFEAVGYKHITTFERAFRRCTGESPAEYKKRLRAARHVESQDSLSSPQGTTTRPQGTPTL